MVQRANIQPSTAPAATSNEAFGEQLAQDARLAGSDGETHGELALAQSIARLHHHDDVGAGNQKHKCNQPHEHVHLVLHLIGVHTDAASRNKVEQRLPALGIDRADSLLGDLEERTLQSLLRLQGGEARTQPRHQAQAPPLGILVELVAARAPGVELLAILKRDPKIERGAGLDALEAVRGNADNGQRYALHVQGLANHRRIACEASRPVVVAYDGDRGVILFVVESEAAAQANACAETAEEVAADLFALRLFRQVAVTHGNSAADT